MDKENVIPFEDALKRGFETSTREELLFYCENLGVDRIDKNGDISKIKDAIFQSLGMARPGPAARPTNLREAPRSSVIPPYNLTPHGRWGGARRRVMLPQPEGAKIARARAFGWNGKATYYLAYNEVVNVPYPIYAILLDMRMPRAKQIPVGDNGEVTTGWDFTPLPFTDLGDDPLTCDLAHSLTEWYQEKGEQFFIDLGDRDLRTVAQALEVPYLDKDRKNRPRDELLGDVLIFLFGYAVNENRVADEAITEA